MIIIIPRIGIIPTESILPKKKKGNTNTNPPSNPGLENARIIIPTVARMKPTMIINFGLFKKDTTNCVTTSLLLLVVEQCLSILLRR